ncbi:MAG: calcium-binding protein [Candidatus Nomurabacteria bacterium]|nr:calcium-binding protein [Candidatus Nomurabacteria bacterium]
MEPQETQKKSNKNLGIGVAIVGLLALIGITYATQHSASTSTDSSTSTAPVTAVPQTTTPTTTPVGNPSTTPVAASAYKDGTYTATGSYMSPGGLDQLGVTVTLKADKITAVSLKEGANDGTSAHYQQIFAGAYTPYVVGKDISILKLDKVSGSSLTGRGFNDAITQIKAQAKA